MSLYLEFDAIVRAFEQARLRYAVAGGLAVGLHGNLRTTEDMDFLMHADDMTSAGVVLCALGYALRNEPWTFKNTRLTLHRFMKPVEGTEDLHVVDLLVPGSAKALRFLEKAVAIPYADITLRVVQAKDLIAMKQARGSKEDELDIQRLRERHEEIQPDDEG